MAVPALTSRAGRRPHSSCRRCGRLATVAREPHIRELLWAGAAALAGLLAGLPQCLAGRLPTAAGPRAQCRVAAHAKGFGDDRWSKNTGEAYGSLQGARSTNRGIDFFNKAYELAACGKHAEAVALYRKARVAMRKANGKSSTDYARVCSNLGASFLALGKTAYAGSVLVESRNAFAESVGTNHPEYASCVTNLARVERVEGDHAEAEALLKEAARVYSQHLQTSHSNYQNVLRSLAALYTETHRPQLARATVQEMKMVQAQASTQGLADGF